MMFVLARADVGVSMGSLGSDAAVEASDVVLPTDEISKLVEAIKISKLWKMYCFKYYFHIDVQGNVFSTWALTTSMGSGFRDVGAMIIAVLNSIRILKIKV